MEFQQAQIPILKVAEFEELRGVIQRVFAPDKVEKFLKGLKKDGIFIRDFESALARKHFERADQALAKSGKTAQGLYQSLAMSDRAQIREFYLVTLEQVDDALRRKYHKIYRCH